VTQTTTVTDTQLDIASRKQDTKYSTTVRLIAVLYCELSR